MTLETSIGPLSQELMGDGTSRIITALRDSPKQGERRTTKEITSMPVVAISLEDVELISTIRTSLLEAEDNNLNAIDLDLNADAIPSGRTLRTWSTSSGERSRQGGGSAH